MDRFVLFEVEKYVGDGDFDGGYGLGLDGLG